MPSRSPLRQIVANAGGEGAVVVNAVREGKATSATTPATEVFEDLHEAGVIDPTKVTRVALENAVSISGMVLTTECVIADVEDPAEAAAAAACCCRCRRHGRHDVSASPQFTTTKSPASAGLFYGADFPKKQRWLNQAEKKRFQPSSNELQQVFCAQVALRHKPIQPKDDR